ncbi:hypothetical protein Y032_0205g1928 [Ancylostoma ceylanicum]|uniref:Uncharacterized protein n=1 Tax=Ancylostoma ceylanicum TaxID=53326 RepID=A0A016SLK2_9BILA|nr:hypothetical protein Y032_0205g1928 [Ancylostoma ceylanicum]
MHFLALAAIVNKVNMRQRIEPDRIQKNSPPTVRLELNIGLGLYYVLDRQAPPIEECPPPRVRRHATPIEASPGTGPVTVESWQADE